MTSSEQFDPDRIPHIDEAVLNLRQDILQDRKLSWHKPPQDEFSRIVRYYDAFQNNITDNLGKLSLSQLPAGDSLTIISEPISVESEQIEELETISQALRKTIETSQDDDSLDHTLVMPWLNFSADPRRERPRGLELHARAQTIAKTILDSMTTDQDPAITSVMLGIDQSIYGKTIPQIRTDQLHATLGLLKSYGFTDLNIPYVLLDADTELSPGALRTIREVLAEGRSLFVSGTLHYVGGVMDLPLDKLYFADPGSKMLYVAETLRRTMIDHLPPRAGRGYPPESGLAMQLDTLVNLGGYDTRLQNNESYGLIHKAEQARKPWFDIDSFRSVGPRSSEKIPDHKPFPEPYIKQKTAERINSYVQYADYTISTSIRGLETAVRRHGVESLTRYDQGHEYELYAHTPQADHEGPLSVAPLNLEKAIDLLNKIYSYFEDCGGVLLAKDLERIERLLHMCFAERYADASYASAVWRPEYIPKEQR